MQKIGIFTSGGDAPGMNAGIRAVVRTCLYHKLQPYAITRGYKGMLEGEYYPLESNNVSNIIQKGGTILKSARCEEFKTQQGRQQAYKQLQKIGISALIAMGGDGTFRGIQIFSKEYNMPCIGIPATIDNDLYGTDYTIGFDTAVNTAITAIDKIRDTAFSHDRVFFVEVMGKNTGYIAVRTAISIGAELVIIPENKISIDSITTTLRNGRQNKKTSFFVIVAEGNHLGNAYTISQKVKKALPKIEDRVSVLGYIQRGGSPTAQDRILASQLGVAAVKALVQGKKDIIVGVVKDELRYTSLQDSLTAKKQIIQNWKQMLDILSL